MINESDNRGQAESGYFGKDLHMSDYEILSIVLMVLGLVLIRDQKRK